MKNIKAKFKKRIWWISMANGFIISNFTSFSNHPERGYIFLGIGVVMLLIACLKPFEYENHSN